MDNLTCRVCGGRLDYKGRGAPPELHEVCRTLANDVTRVKRGLELAWNHDQVKRRQLRGWLIGELLSLLNQQTASSIKRKAGPTAAQRLERIIASLMRTRAGREALRSKGLDINPPS